MVLVGVPNEVRYVLGQGELTRDINGTQKEDLDVITTGWQGVGK
jgi:hypothetical protein